MIPRPAPTIDIGKWILAAGFALSAALIVTLPLGALLPEAKAGLRTPIQYGGALCVLLATGAMRRPSGALVLGCTLIGAIFLILPVMHHVRPDLIVPAIPTPASATGLDRYLADLFSGILSLLATGLGIAFGTVFLLVALLVALFNRT